MSLATKNKTATIFFLGRQQRENIIGMTDNARIKSPETQEVFFRRAINIWSIVVHILAIPIVPVFLMVRFVKFLLRCNN